MAARQNPRFWIALLALVWFLFSPMMAPVVTAVVDVVTLVPVSDDLWVVVDDLPAEIAPAFVDQLLTYLSPYIQPADRDLPVRPAVVRFVPDAAADRPFPVGTEGFGGLTGSAHGWCFPQPSTDAARHCLLWPAGRAESTASLVTLVTVRIQDDPQTTAGYLVHELTHLCGAVDGVRCPAHDDYSPNAKYAPDHQDAYWWFGVTGLFNLRPAGVVWEALNNRCANSDDPVICAELAVLLSDAVP